MNERERQAGIRDVNTALTEAADQVAAAAAAIARTADTLTSILAKCDGLLAALLPLTSHLSPLT